ncbi:MAG: DNA polymerase I [Patescibacteria group bacterium]
MSKRLSGTVLLIDANALIHRAWHALPPLTAPDGRVVNAVYGFASVLMNIVARERPTYLVVCWDTPEPTYRHEANKEYKAGRLEQPDEFYNQFPWVKEVVEVFGGTNVELPGYEADDLLGTFATEFAKVGVEVTLLTSDKDVWQLIAPHVRVMAFKKGVTDTVIYDEKTLKEVTGLTADQMVDFKALRGDASDNLKGVPGVGEKTATDLLLAYKNLEAVFKAAHDPKSKLSPSVRQKLVDGEKSGRETLHLVQLMLDAPVKEKLEDLARREVNQEDLKRLFSSFGFKTLLARAIGKTSGEAALSPIKNTVVNAKMKKAPRTTVLVPTVTSDATHVLKPTADDIDRLVEAAKEEGMVIARPADVAQTSLFAEAPGLALGTKKFSVLIPSSMLQGAAMKKIASLLKDEKIKKNGHGIKVLCHWAVAHDIELQGIGTDVEIVAGLVSAGEGKQDLVSLAAGNLGIVFADGDDRLLAEVDAIRILALKFEEELKAQNLLPIWERFEQPLIPVLTRMEEHGIMINRPYFKELTERFRSEKARLEKEMEKLAGEPFNPGSPQQLGRVLFDVLKLPIKGIKRGKTGISTAASELEKLEGAHPIVEKITEYREVAKLLSTYVESTPALADSEGRIHTTYNQLGAATGRMSSTNPNLQNIPIRTELGREIRRGFVAAKGYRLVSCDYSQIELRVIAALAKDKKMLEAFHQNVDIHTATAAAIWHVDLDEVTKDQRRAAKAINFGIIYGQGPVGLSKTAGVSFDEAKQFIAEYFHVYSGVREYLDQTKVLARAQGYVETLFGRRRPTPDINSPMPQFRAAAERMAINMPVQGTAADLMKIGMIEVDAKLPKISPGSRLLLQVHDELVLEVPEDEVEKVAAAVQDIMQTVEKIGVPIVVDAKEGKNWEEMKKTA